MGPYDDFSDSELPVNLIVCGTIFVVQMAVIPLSCFALGGGQWIKSVRDETDYFTRVRSDITSSFSSNYYDSLFESMGLWRIWTSSSDSLPLPIRDDEVIASSFLMISGGALAMLCLIMTTYMALGVLKDSVTAAITLFWVALLESMFLMTAAILAQNYFTTTFEFDRWGYNVYLAWVAFGVSVCAPLIAAFKVYMLVDAKGDQKDSFGKARQTKSQTQFEFHMPSQSTELYSRGSASDGYNQGHIPAKTISQTYYSPEQQVGYDPHHASYGTQRALMSHGV